MAEADWNGFLRLSLVSCPITLSPATSDAQRVKLDLLSARTGNPLAQQYVDARIGERGRPAQVAPQRAGLMVSTLHTEEELIVAGFGERPEDATPAEMIGIAEAIIARRAGDFDPRQLRDRYQDDLRKLVEQKAGNAPPALAPARRPPNTGRSAPPPPAAEAAAPAPKPASPPPEPWPA